MSSADRTRAQQRLFSSAIAVACALSLAAYLAFSRELRFELADLPYKRALLGQFASERGLGAVRLLRTFAWQGMLLCAALAACAYAAGRTLRMALGQRRGWPEVAALSLGAVVVPTLLLAAIFWPDGGGHLGTATMLGGTVAVAVTARCALWWRRAAIGTLPPLRVTTDQTTASTGVAQLNEGRAWAIALLVLLVPLVVAVWWNGLDTIRGFDSLSDHLPRAARWLKLSRLSDESGQLLTPYYPGDFQLFVRWVLVLGTDAYAFLPALLATLVALGALYGICREIGQTKWIALVSTACAATCLLLPYLSTTVEADTAVAALLLLAVLLLLRWLRTLQPPTEHDLTPSYSAAALVAFGTSLGLAVGTKYSALPPALVVVAVAGFYAWRASFGAFTVGRRYFNARALVMMLLAVALPAIACAGYWMLRNTILHGNPLYPVATAGLPGVSMRYIIPIKPALSSSWLARLSYPWVQWDFVSVYDDGLGAPFAAIALIAFLVVPFRKAPAGSRRRMVWGITLAAFALWIGTGSITARFGLFPILLTFAMVGELWREAGSIALKAVTIAAAAITIAVTTQSLVVGAVYTTLLPPGKRGVPAIVDSLPPARIFNATSASNRYPLLGRDYRHEVITMFAAAKPGDVKTVAPEYVLLNASQVYAFNAENVLELVRRGPPLAAGDTLSLWRVSK